MLYSYISYFKLLCFALKYLSTLRIPKVPKIWQTTVLTLKTDFSETGVRKLWKWNFTATSKFSIGIPERNSSGETIDVYWIWIHYVASEGRIVKYKLCRRAAQCEIASRENSMGAPASENVGHFREINRRSRITRELKSWGREGNSYRSHKRRSLRENEACIPRDTLHNLLYSAFARYDAICA